MDRYSEKNYKQLAGQPTAEPRSGFPFISDALPSTSAAKPLSPNSSCSAGNAPSVVPELTPPKPHIFGPGCRVAEYTVSAAPESYQERCQEEIFCGERAESQESVPVPDAAPALPPAAAGQNEKQAHATTAAAVSSRRQLQPRTGSVLANARIFQPAIRMYTSAFPRVKGSSSAVADVETQTDGFVRRFGTRAVQAGGGDGGEYSQANDREQEAVKPGVRRTTHGLGPPQPRRRQPPLGSFDVRNRIIEDRRSQQALAAARRLVAVASVYRPRRPLEYGYSSSHGTRPGAESQERHHQPATTAPTATVSTSFSPDSLERRQQHVNPGSGWSPLWSPMHSVNSSATADDTCGAEQAVGTESSDITEPLLSSDQQLSRPDQPIGVATSDAVVKAPVTRSIYNRIKGPGYSGWMEKEHVKDAEVCSHVPTESDDELAAEHAADFSGYSGSSYSAVLGGDAALGGRDHVHSVKSNTYGTQFGAPPSSLMSLASRDKRGLDATIHGIDDVIARFDAGLLLAGSATAAASGTGSSVESGASGAHSAAGGLRPRLSRQPSIGAAATPQSPSTSASAAISAGILGPGLPSSIAARLQPDTGTVAARILDRTRRGAPWRSAARGPGIPVHRSGISSRPSDRHAASSRIGTGGVAGTESDDVTAGSASTRSIADSEIQQTAAEMSPPPALAQPAKSLQSSEAQTSAGSAAAAGAAAALQQPAGEVFHGGTGVADFASQFSAGDREHGDVCGAGSGLHYGVVDDSTAAAGAYAQGPGSTTAQRSISTEHSEGRGPDDDGSDVGIGGVAEEDLQDEASGSSSSTSADEIDDSGKAGAGTDADAVSHLATAGHEHHHRRVLQAYHRSAGAGRDTGDTLQLAEEGRFRSYLMRKAAKASAKATPGSRDAAVPESFGADSSIKTNTSVSGSGSAAGNGASHRSGSPSDRGEADFGGRGTSTTAIADREADQRGVDIGTGVNTCESAPTRGLAVQQPLLGSVPSASFAPPSAPSPDFATARSIPASDIDAAAAAEIAEMADAVDTTGSGTGEAAAAGLAGAGAEFEESGADVTVSLQDDRAAVGTSAGQRPASAAAAAGADARTSTQTSSSTSVLPDSEALNQQILLVDDEAMAASLAGIPVNSVSGRGAGGSGLVVDLESSVHPQELLPQPQLLVRGIVGSPPHPTPFGSGTGGLRYHSTREEEDDDDAGDDADEGEHHADARGGSDANGASTELPGPPPAQTPDEDTSEHPERFAVDVRKRTQGSLAANEAAGSGFRAVSAARVQGARE